MLEGRDWFKLDGASAEDLAYLRTIMPDERPGLYFDLLKFSNGGEGPLACDPYNLCLDPARTVAETIESENHGQADLRGFLIFGNNGGGEYLAFDTRAGAQWPIVTIDMVAGGSSAAVIASDFAEFCDLIGIESEEV